ncbi:MAG: nucleotidyltransferase domain-containing protein [Actinomycetota bacterium]
MDLEPVVWAFRGALGPRLGGLAVHGSAVTGDLIPGFSDLDLLVVLDEPLSLEDALALQRRMPELPQIAYVQPSYRPASEPVPHLVPGAHRVLTGSVPAGFVHDDATLRAVGEEALTELPSLLDQDMRDWTGAVGEKRGRHVRLLSTRLKPAVRATLVRLGEPPLEAWRLHWDDLAQRWRRHDEPRAEDLGDVLIRLRASPRDDRTCGEALLRLLASIAATVDPA